MVDDVTVHAVGEDEDTIELTFVRVVLNHDAVIAKLKYQSLIPTVGFPETPMRSSPSAQALQVIRIKVHPINTVLLHCVFSYSR